MVPIFDFVYELEACKAKQYEFFDLWPLQRHMHATDQPRSPPKEAITFSLNIVMTVTVAIFWRTTLCENERSFSLKRESSSKNLMRKSFSWPYWIWFWRQIKIKLLGYWFVQDFFSTYRKSEKGYHLVGKSLPRHQIEFDQYFINISQSCFIIREFWSIFFETVFLDFLDFLRKIFRRFYFRPFNSILLNLEM